MRTPDIMLANRDGRDLEWLRHCLGHVLTDVRVSLGAAPLLYFSAVQLPPRQCDNDLAVSGWSSPSSDVSADEVEMRHLVAPGGATL